MFGKGFILREENDMIIKSVNLETVCGITSKLPDNTLPEVAFAGKSNVGKSSLINALMNRKALARTSAQPGKTQTINFYKTGNTAQIKATALPGGKQMASKTLTYKSSNPQVAVVNSKGKVTAKKGGYSRIQISTAARSGKICTKDVDVFVYDGFDDVCSETSGSKTTFTFNPNWKSVTIYFTSQTGKQYSYKVDSIKTEFNMLANVKGFADERNGVAVSKDSARKANIINFKIIETGEDYDVLADAQRYQLTFYKALNNKVTFNVEK